jgi:hypothetical protein
MSQYISRKSDAQSKPATQPLPANKWITVEVENLTELVPTENSKTGALWACYLNIDSPRINGATELVLRWTRDPKGINDGTGYETKALKKGGTTFIKDVWLFQAKKGQPVVLQVRANGWATITTREVKLAIT